MVHQKPHVLITLCNYGLVYPPNHHSVEGDLSYTHMILYQLLYNIVIYQSMYAGLPVYLYVYSIQEELHIKLLLLVRLITQISQIAE